jgi:hypothetical protein
VIVNDTKYNITGKSEVVVVTVWSNPNESKNSNSITGSTIINKTPISPIIPQTKPSHQYQNYIIPAILIIGILIILIIAKFKKKILHKK